MDIEKEIQEIKDRNVRVEKDKAWETSKTRAVLILILTYLVILSFMLVSHIEKPFYNAAVPAIAFSLSTLVVGPVKKWWLKKFSK